MFHSEGLTKTSPTSLDAAVFATCGFLAGDVVHMFHVVPNVADAADGTPADPGLAALADVPVAVPRNDSAQDAANVRCLAALFGIS